MSDVFISYRSTQSEQAYTVMRALESCGISCWIAPRNIPGGSSYTMEIPRGILDCKAFVLIGSSDVQSSQWVLRELETAIKHQKVIIPYMLEDFDSYDYTDEFDFLLGICQYYDTKDKRIDTLDQLVARIKEVIEAEKDAEHRRDARSRPTRAIVFCPKCGSRDVEMDEGFVLRTTEEEKLFFKPLVLHVNYLTYIAHLILMLFMNDLHTKMLVLSFVTRWLLSCLLLYWCIIAFGIDPVNRWLDRKHAREHIVVWPMRCENCEHKFSVSRSEDTMPPWADED